MKKASYEGFYYTQQKGKENEHSPQYVDYQIYSLPVNADAMN